MKIQLTLFLFLLFSFTFINCSNSQNVYLVQSIKEIPAYKCFLIKVHNVDDTLKTNEIWIISNYTEKQVYEMAVKIEEKMNIAKLNLVEIVESENPFKSLFQKNRNGYQAIYIDGELFYDPKIKLYSSICIEGLFYKVECK